MSTINAVGVGLSGQTGTGAFVGSVNPAINNVLAGYTTTVTSATPIVLVVGSNYQQYLTGSTAQTVTMPVTSTLVLGQSFLIVNDSSQTTTVNSSGGNLIESLPAGSQGVFTVIAITGTTAASWASDFVANIAGVASITGTANQIIASAATGAVTLSLASNVANAFSQVAVQTFTGSGTYTPTTGMKYCIVEAVAGGGGGGGAASGGGAIYVSAGGGGAGGYARVLYTAAQIGASKAVTIGAAGAAGSAGNNVGGTGGTTTFGATLFTMTGGIGGAGGSTAGNATTAAGGTTTVSSGTIIASVSGMPGHSGTGAGTGVYAGTGGNGGTSPFGAGGIGPSSGANATGGAAQGYGAGGGGGADLTGTQTGGAGTAGFLVVTEYI